MQKRLQAKKFFLLLRFIKT